MNVRQSYLIIPSQLGENIGWYEWEVWLPWEYSLTDDFNDHIIVEILANRIYGEIYNINYARVPMGWRTSLTFCGLAPECLTYYGGVPPDYN
jgi:hypothetical protein